MLLSDKSSKGLIFALQYSLEQIHFSHGKSNGVLLTAAKTSLWIQGPPCTPPDPTDLLIKNGASRTYLHQRQQVAARRCSPFLH